MLWLKAFHIFFVVSWFAGLFYLPRIFVNLAMIAPDSAAERERLLLMARKLYRFVTPIALLSVVSGLWLGYWIGYQDLWIQLKTGLVAGLLVFHFHCGTLLQRFQRGDNTHSHVWFRIFNEVPVFFLLAVCILVVVKPF